MRTSTVGDVGTFNPGLAVAAQAVQAVLCPLWPLSSASKFDMEPVTPLLNRL